MKIEVGDAMTDEFRYNESVYDANSHVWNLTVSKCCSNSKYLEVDEIISCFSPQAFTNRTLF